jgi:hypothetical protein
MGKVAVTGRADRVVRPYKRPKEGHVAAKSSDFAPVKACIYIPDRDHDKLDAKEGIF